MPSLCHAQPPAATQTPSAEEASIPEAQLRAWVENLGSPSYRTRRVAAQRLLTGDQSCVPVLEDCLQGADLETTNGVVKVLLNLSLSFDPLSGGTDRAWNALQNLSTVGSSSAATRAHYAMVEVRAARSDKALDELSSARVFVGEGKVHVGSSIQTESYHVRISSDWNGRPETLFWLQWIENVDTLVISGKNVTPGNMKKIARMPNLRILIIRDAKVTPQHLQPFTKLAQLNHFQLVNVQSGDELIESIANLPVRRELTLFGTDITPKGRDQLIQKLPGLELHCRAGFLGVQCSSLAPICEVTEVTPDSGAQDGGVLPGDVITKFGEHPVQRFEDLQNAIGKYTAAEKDIPLVVIRNGKEQKLTVQLKRKFP